MEVHVGAGRGNCLDGVGPGEFSEYICGEHLLKIFLLAKWTDYFLQKYVLIDFEDARSSMHPMCNQNQRHAMDN